MAGVTKNFGGSGGFTDISSSIAKIKAVLDIELSKKSVKQIEAARKLVEDMLSGLSNLSEQQRKLLVNLGVELGDKLRKAEKSVKNLGDASGKTSKEMDKASASIKKHSTIISSVNSTKKKSIDLLDKELKASALLVKALEGKVNVTTRVEKANKRYSASIGDILSKAKKSREGTKGFKVGLLEMKLFLMHFGLMMRGIQQAGMVINKTFGSVIRKYKELESEMAFIGTLVPGNKILIGNLTEEYRLLGNQLAKTAKEIAEGAYHAVSAGVEISKSLDFMETSVKAALAGRSGIQESTKLLVQTANAFGYEVEQVKQIADIFFQTVRYGVTTYGELAQNFSKVSATANMLKVPLQSVSAGVATLTKKGVPTNEAMTSLNALLLMVIKKQGVAASMGQKVAEAFSLQSLAAKGLQRYLLDVWDAVGKDVSAFNMLFTRTRSIKAAGNLVGDGGKQAIKDLLRLGNSAGATELALKEMSDTLSFRSQKALSTYTNSISKIGESYRGNLIGVLELLNRFAENIGENIGLVKAFAFFLTSGGLSLALILVGSKLTKVIKSFLSFKVEVIENTARLKSYNLALQEAKRQKMEQATAIAYATKIRDAENNAMAKSAVLQAKISRGLAIFGFGVVAVTAVLMILAAVTRSKKLEIESTKRFIEVQKEELEENRKLLESYKKLQAIQEETGETSKELEATTELVEEAFAGATKSAEGYEFALKGVNTTLEDFKEISNSIRLIELGYQIKEKIKDIPIDFYTSGFKSTVSNEILDALKHEFIPEGVMNTEGVADIVSKLSEGVDWGSILGTDIMSVFGLFDVKIKKARSAKYRLEEVNKALSLTKEELATTRAMEVVSEKDRERKVDLLRAYSAIIVSLNIQKGKLDEIVSLQKERKDIEDGFIDSTEKAAKTISAIKFPDWNSDVGEGRFKQFMNGIERIKEAFEISSAFTKHSEEGWFKINKYENFSLTTRKALSNETYQYTNKLKTLADQEAAIQSEHIKEIKSLLEGEVELEGGESLVSLFGGSLKQHLGEGLTEAEAYIEIAKEFKKIILGISEGETAFSSGGVDVVFTGKEQWYLDALKQFKMVLDNKELITKYHNGIMEELHRRDRENLVKNLEKSSEKIAEFNEKQKDLAIYNTSYYKGMASITKEWDSLTSSIEEATKAAELWKVKPELFEKDPTMKASLLKSASNIMDFDVTFMDSNSLVEALDAKLVEVELFYKNIIDDYNEGVLKDFKEKLSSLKEGESFISSIVEDSVTLSKVVDEMESLKENLGLTDANISEYRELISTKKDDQINTAMLNKLYSESGVQIDDNTSAFIALDEAIRVYNASLDESESLIKDEVENRKQNVKAIRDQIYEITRLRLELDLLDQDQEKPKNTNSKSLLYFDFSGIDNIKRIRQDFALEKAGWEKDKDITVEELSYLNATEQAKNNIKNQEELDDELIRLKEEHEAKKHAIELDYLNKSKDIQEGNFNLTLLDKLAMFQEFTYQIAQKAQKLFGIASAFTDNIFGAQSAKIETETNRINKSYDDREKKVESLAENYVISEREKDERLKDLQEDRERDLKDIALKEQSLKIKQAYMNMSAAIIQAWASYPFYIALPLTLFIAQKAKAEIEAIKSQSFATGVIDYKGKGSTTSDSNTVRISNRESIITAEGTLKNKGALEYANKGGSVIDYVLDLIRSGSSSFGSAGLQIPNNFYSGFSGRGSLSSSNDAEKGSDYSEAPIIHNVINAKFSKKDLAFIYEEGKYRSNRTSLGRS